jgi:hypothetical protein
MNEQAKKIIEGVERLDFYPDGMESYKDGDYVRFDDLTTIVDVLTKEIEALKKADEWVSAEEKTPICSEVGNWDGKRSEIVMVKTVEGEIITARLYSGFLDGKNFNEWAETRYSYIIHVFEWKPIN